jgi:hypothetical protein
MEVSKFERVSNQKYRYLRYLMWITVSHCQEVTLMGQAAWKPTIIELILDACVKQERNVFMPWAVACLLANCETKTPSRG